MKARPDQVVAGHRLLRLIGQGASSSVYLATHESTGRSVALKLVVLAASGGGAEAARSAFLAAAASAARLQHPGIVVVHAAGIEGTMGWLAMEAVPGTDLSRYTRVPRLLPELLALRVAQHMAHALAYAHGLGVVHRDIKPANVLVHWPSQTIKIVDFGIARATDAAQTDTGIVLGTPAYMAPEQLAGALPTAASDFYALGVTLFELLTGRLPHEATRMGELLRQVASDAAPDLRSLRPDLPTALAQLLARLLDKRPSARPASGELIADALGALLSSPAAQSGLTPR
jgi:serine/threonine-protein kinase